MMSINIALMLPPRLTQHKTEIIKNLEFDVYVSTSQTHIDCVCQKAISEGESTGLPGAAFMFMPTLSEKLA